MKKLLILGGFPQMINIVMLAKSMGIYTVLADNNKNSPVKRFVDKAVDSSTDQIDRLVELCKNEHIDGIFTGFEDFNIHVACELCSKLSLPFYADSAQLAVITNKIMFKEKCREYGVPVIEQYTREEAIAEGRYPYIVKPADSYGSRGISVCSSYDELTAGYKKATETSYSHSTIIERYINSNHGVELFYTVVNGNIHLTVTADRYVVYNRETSVPLPIAEVFPSKHRDDIVNVLDESIRKMLRGLRIQNGVVLIQALYDGKDYYVYEMAYRLSGEQHYRLVFMQHGINLAEMMLKLALGENIPKFDTELIDDSSFCKPSINLAVLLNPGKINEIKGLEKVYRLNEVISYNLTHKETDVISASGDYSHMLIRINMVADSYTALSHAVDNVNDYIEVTSDTGEDMITSRFSLREVE